VEAEVARRLQEREREEEERRMKGQEQIQEQVQGFQGSGRSKSRSPKKEQSLPSGVLTPLLQRHRDLDDELKARLQELERKLCVFLARLLFDSAED
jgi:kinesin family member 22